MVHIPYAGDVRVVVTTAPDQPSLLVARSSFGAPRPEFIDATIKRLFGTQDNGDIHRWTIIEQPKSPLVVIQVTDNPRVNSFLEEKVNGPEAA